MAPAWNAGEAKSPCRFDSCPFRLIRSCSWESSGSPKPAEWVRILPALLCRQHLSSWASLEWPPPCQGGDREFKSPRGRCHRTVPREARGPSDTRGNAGSNPAGPTRQSRGAVWSARHPDMVEIAGSNPAGTTDILPWPSGNGSSFTRRRAQVRVLPGVLRSGLESGFQHGLISRSTPVQIRPPQLARPSTQTGKAARSRAW